MGVAINIKRKIGILAGILVIAVSIPTIAVTASNSEGVNVCVDWETKQVKFSKYWEECPAKHTQITLGARGETGPQGEVGPQGPAGPAGADGSRGPRGASGESGGSSYPWGDEGTCYQKLQAALNSGYNMIFRIDRGIFEDATSCEVNKILDVRAPITYRETPFAFVSEVEFQSDDGATDAEYSVWGEATYMITIGNWESLSALEFYGSEYGYCSRYNNEYLIDLGGGSYLGTFEYFYDYDEAFVTIDVGIKVNGRCATNPHIFPDIKIYEEPSLIAQFRPSLLERWGW